MSISRLPLSVATDHRLRIQVIVDFWKDLYDGGDPGGAPWEELDRIHHEVTDCLGRNPQEISRAENLTALACLLISGKESF